MKLLLFARTNFQIQHNRIKNLNWQEATIWLFTNVAEDSTRDNREQIQQVVAAGQPGTFELRVWRADHSVMLPHYYIIIFLGEI